MSPVHLRYYNDEVYNRVVDADNRPLIRRIALHRPQWFGHLLRMPAHCLPCRAIFARAR